MYSRFAPLLLAIVVLALPASVLAQARTITLEEAIQIARSGNVDVVQARNNIGSADASVRAAYGDYLPSLGATAGWNWSQSSRTQNQLIDIPGVGLTETQQEFFGASDQWSTGVNASYTLFDGLRREANLSGSKSRLTVAEKSSERTCQAIVYQVISEYLNILRTEQLVKVSAENLKRDERQLERITESSRVGALPLADVYRQQSQVANDELDLITTQNNHDKAKADLAALIGLDPSVEYVYRDATVTAHLDSASAAATLAQYRDLAALTGRALQSRPDLEAARAGLESASSDVSAANGSYWPSLGLSGGYGNFSADADQLALTRNYNLNAGVNMRWNLFDGFSRELAVEQAKVQERNAEVQLEQAKKEVAVEVRKALLDLEAAKKSWDVSEKALRSASEDRRIAEERYNLGAGTLLDLLVANATFVNSQAARVNAIAGFLNARYNVEFALGERPCDPPRER